MKDEMPSIPDSDLREHSQNINERVESLLKVVGQQRNPNFSDEEYEPTAARAANISLLLTELPAVYSGLTGRELLPHEPTRFEGLRRVVSNVARAIINPNEPEPLGRYLKALNKLVAQELSDIWFSSLSVPFDDVTDMKAWQRLLNIMPHTRPNNYLQINLTAADFATHSGILSKLVNSEERAKRISEQKEEREQKLIEGQERKKELNRFNPTLASEIQSDINSIRSNQSTLVPLELDYIDGRSLMDEEKVAERKGIIVNRLLEDFLKDGIRAPQMMDLIDIEKQGVVEGPLDAVYSIDAFNYLGDTNELFNLLKTVFDGLRVDGKFIIIASEVPITVSTHYPVETASLSASGKMWKDCEFGLHSVSPIFPDDHNILAGFLGVPEEVLDSQKDPATTHQFAQQIQRAILGRTAPNLKQIRYYGFTVDELKTLLQVVGFSIAEINPSITNSSEGILDGKIYIKANKPRSRE